MPMDVGVRARGGRPRVLDATSGGPRRTPAGMGQAWAAGPYACVGVSAGLKLNADRLAPQLCRGFPRSSAGDWSKRRAVVMASDCRRRRHQRSEFAFYRFCCSIRLFSFRHGVFRYPFSHSLAAAPRHCYATQFVQTRTDGSATRQQRYRVDARHGREVEDGDVYVRGEHKVPLQRTELQEIEPRCPRAGPRFPSVRNPCKRCDTVTSELRPLAL